MHLALMLESDELDANSWDSTAEEDLLDLIETAFLDGQIDGETLTLAFAWLEANYSVMH